MLLHSRASGRLDSWAQICRTGGHQSENSCGHGCNATVSRRSGQYGGPNTDGGEGSFSRNGMCSIYDDMKGDEERYWVRMGVFVEEVTDVEPVHGGRFFLGKGFNFVEKDVGQDLTIMGGREPGGQKRSNQFEDSTWKLSVTVNREGGRRARGGLRGRRSAEGNSRSGTHYCQEDALHLVQAWVTVLRRSVQK